MEVKLLPVSSRTYRISDITSGGVFRNRDSQTFMKIVEREDFSFNAVSIKGGRLKWFDEGEELTKIKGSFQEELWK